MSDQSSSTYQHIPSNRIEQPIKLETIKDEDYDEKDNIILLDEFSRPPPPVVECLVKTGGKLDYHDDCLCVKCRLIKDFLAKIDDCEQDCKCEECLVNGKGARQGAKGASSQKIPSSSTNKKCAKTNPNECPFCKTKAHNSMPSMSTHYRVAHLNLNLNEKDSYVLPDDDEVDIELDQMSDNHAEDHRDDLYYDFSNASSSKSLDKDVNQLEGKVEPSTENVPNGVGSIHPESLIQDDASTSEHVASDRDDQSRSSTPDYLPRFFDDESESGDSSSEDDDDEGEEDVHDHADSSNGTDNTSTKPSPTESHSNHSETIKTVKRYLCPSCSQSFTEKKHVYRHYRTVHLQLKAYYCKWAKCDFITGRCDYLAEHIILKHFNMIKDKRVNNYIGKRKAEEKKDIDIEVKSSYCNVSQTRISCQLCGRNFNLCAMESHLRTHKSIGFRCIWSGCGFFYSQFESAVRHVRVDHLKMSKAEITNRESIYQYLNKFDPDTNEATPIVRKEREKKACPAPSNSIKCPTCEAGFGSILKLSRHYREQHLDWKPYYCTKCDFIAGKCITVVDHANQKHFNSKDKQSARGFVAKRQNEQAPNDAVLESLLKSRPKKSKQTRGQRKNLTPEACAECGRMFAANYMKAHLLTHQRPGYRCTWSGCGFFFSSHEWAQRHICTDHMQCTLETITNLEEIDQYLVNH